MVFSESMLHDLNMNYYNTKTKTPFSSVQYFKEEHEYYHPWSLKSSGKMFGFHKLHEVISLKDFMEWPMCVTDELLDGITEGRNERDKLDNPNPPDADGKSSTNKDLKAIMQQLGLDKKLF
jgi:hypothetical protein